MRLLRHTGPTGAGRILAVHGAQSSSAPLADTGSRRPPPVRSDWAHFRARRWPSSPVHPSWGRTADRNRYRRPARPHHDRGGHDGGQRRPSQGRPARLERRLRDGPHQSCVRQRPRRPGPPAPGAAGGSQAGSGHRLDRGGHADGSLAVQAAQPSASGRHPDEPTTEAEVTTVDAPEPNGLRSGSTTRSNRRASATSSKCSGSAHGPNRDRDLGQPAGNREAAASVTRRPSAHEEDDELCSRPIQEPGRGRPTVSQASAGRRVDSVGAGQLLYGRGRRFRVHGR